MMLEMVAFAALIGASIACWQQWVYRTAVVAEAVRRVVSPVADFFDEGLRRGALDANDFLAPDHLQESLALRSLAEALGPGSLKRDCLELLRSYGEVWSSAPPPVSWNEPAVADGIWAVHEDAAARARSERQLEAAR